MYITSSTLTYPYVDMHLSEFGMGMGMVLSIYLSPMKCPTYQSSSTTANCSLLVCGILSSMRREKGGRKGGKGDIDRGGRTGKEKEEEKNDTSCVIITSGIYDRFLR